MNDTDLWNKPIGAFKGKRKDPIPKGHAGPPGGGPDGETCATCRHITKISYSKSYFKCLLTKPNWTHSRGSDIRKKDAACWKWEPKETP